MKQPKVSIIVPVYNVEKYLDRCMQSLLGQTLKELEIILVDDGSPDNSPALCDNYESASDNLHWPITMQSRVERIVTIAYLSLVKIDRALSRNLADFEAYWVALQDIKALAFDHNLIIKEALVYIRQYVEINPSALFDLLPRKFTASQLRTLYELIYSKPIDVRNFHKKIAMMEYVVPLEEKQQGVAHRAARYYRSKK